MDMFEKKGQEEPEKTDELGDIRRQYEQAQLEESLKTVVFGGYSKKKVNEIISTYKEMINLMQGNFDYHLQELNAEKERVCNERIVLKKQLNEELEKNKKMESLLEDAEYWKNQYQEQRARYEAVNQSLLATQEEKADLLKQCSASYRRLEELEAKLEELQQQEQQKLQQEPSPGPDGDPTLIAALTRQLEEITSYCEAMETQQRSLEGQISSMKNISRELEKLSLQYEENQEELKEVRRKYNNVKTENYSLNSEMESTSQILEEILVQFEQRENENDKLHQEINEYQEQLMAVKKEKLAQDQSNLTYMERAYNAEKEMRETQEELRRTQKELEELRKEYNSLENSKVIKIQNAPADIPEKEKIDELLKRASAVTGRSFETDEKTPGKDTVSITNDKEIL
ncbi:hypothetical protein C0033_00380 [Clostridium sp. chh4-2]|uniref:hypothetical protein n=1 Tax=Clostridium sp. chh4-2 TaxID=2067550 RepID=UPI000CCE8525|nr:hypothetical protein [Clostridium sp. chh4-2]PNV63825.1 hypothetical protein C0033_00380 [Clostridium sp. chh4-2]